MEILMDLDSQNSKDHVPLLGYVKPKQLFLCFTVVILWLVCVELRLLLGMVQGEAS
jgi:hypothetical protein